NPTEVVEFRATAAAERVPCGPRSRATSPGRRGSVAATSRSRPDAAQSLPHGGPTVLAYLDAGSASVAASIVAAGVAGAGVAARSALSKLKRGKKSSPAEPS